MLNTYAGLTVPLIASATATFLFRQFFLTIPDELAEAARIDGAGPMRFFWDVVVPLSRPNIAALFVILFIYGWNQYLWPLLVTTDEDMYTTVIGIKRMISGGDAATEWNLVMATAMLAMLPPALVVLLMQKWFVKGLVDIGEMSGAHGQSRTPRRPQELRRHSRSSTASTCDVADGEFVVIVGPSGCGKSTLLRMVAGLEAITAGEIAIGDRVVNKLEPKDRDIAMVFQNYALYPHMSVFDNMAYGLKIRGFAKDDIQARVDRAAEILELGPLLDAQAARSSPGGQRQRVAMGRAIVREPAVFLFDEPLSNLDAKLRVQMRFEIQKLHRRLATTSLYVTHDQVEAMTLAQRMIVMNAGRAEQIGTPMEVYENPATLFVAGFIGSPAMNFLPGRSTAAARSRSTPAAVAVARGGRAPAGRAVIGRHPARASRAVRRKPMRSFAGRSRWSSSSAPTRWCTSAHGARRVIARLPHGIHPAIGTTLHARRRPRRACYLFDAADGARMR